MMRRYGSPALPGRRYQYRPGAYAILLRGREVLLTVQDGAPPEFQLPGGGIDPGETPMQAVRRETLEETGWRAGPLKRFSAYRRFTFMPEYQIWAEKICVIYAGQPVRSDRGPSEPDHIAIFVDVDAAVDLLASEGDRACLKAFLRLSCEAHRR